MVVGAGPTGLTLAAQLHAFGASVRVVDEATGCAHQSRALAVQLRIHAGGRVVRAQLFDIGVGDTAFPFLLFVSQAITEEVLGAHRTVREQTGTAFSGGHYPQTFLLADLSAVGPEPGAVNVYLNRTGPLLLFPLGHPARGASSRCGARPPGRPHRLPRRQQRRGRRGALPHPRAQLPIVNWTRTGRWSELHRSRMRCDSGATPAFVR